MGCVITIIALFVPRILLFVLWASTSYTKQAFEGWFWPLAGFFFMPYTTLAYLTAMINNDHSVSGGWLILLVVAVLFDIGSWGTCKGSDE